jgi:hypothetical protein
MNGGGGFHTRMPRYRVSQTYHLSFGTVPKCKAAICRKQWTMKEKEKSGKRKQEKK